MSERKATIVYFSIQTDAQPWYQDTSETMCDQARIKRSYGRLE